MIGTGFILVLLIRSRSILFSMKHLKTLLLVLFTASLTAQSMEEAQGLAVGDKAPLTTLRDAQSEAVNLQEALKNGPIILVFYRGEWCPYCNRHLAALNEITDSLAELNVQLFAISPEKPDLLQEMMSKTESNFTFLSDSAYQTIIGFNLAFLPSKATRMKYKSVLGVDLSEAHQDSREFLPVPATYLIDQEGIIRWRHFDPDYKERSEPKEVLAAARALNS